MIVKYPHVHIKVEIVNSPLKLKSETPRGQGWRSRKRISCWFVGVYFFFLRFLVVLCNGCVFPTTDVSNQNSEAGGTNGEFRCNKRDNSSLTKKNFKIPFTRKTSKQRGRGSAISRLLSIDRSFLRIHGLNKSVNHPMMHSVNSPLRNLSSNSGFTTIRSIFVALNTCRIGNNAAHNTKWN